MDVGQAARASTRRSQPPTEGANSAEGGVAAAACIWRERGHFMEEAHRHNTGGNKRLRAAVAAEELAALPADRADVVVLLLARVALLVAAKELRGQLELAGPESAKIRHRGGAVHEGYEQAARDRQRESWQADGVQSPRPGPARRERIGADCFRGVSKNARGTAAEVALGR